MPRLAFAQSFWDGYDTLDKLIRAGVHKAMAKFQALSVAELNADKGLHLESVENARDPRMRTIRITGFWRGVVLAPDDGSDTFLLVNVLPHDDAYTWAAKRLYSANSATRALEVRNAVALDELTPLYETAARTAPRLLFAGISDGTLRELGVDAQVLRAARSLVDKAQLEAFSLLLPEDQLEVLQYLAEGFSPEEVYRDVVAVRRPADAPAEPVEDLATVIANTPARIRLVTGPQELEDILEKPFDAWRVFLHPSQRRVAYRTSYGGPVQVTGGPGTGKTVAALHRIKHLLGRSEDGRILLTTYTNALAAGLRDLLGLLLEQDERLLARVDVTTVDAYANGIVRAKSATTPRPVGDREQLQLWEKAVKQLDLPFTARFLAQEYRHIILGQNLRSLDTYLGASRRGRGTGLGPTRRQEVWNGVERFEQYLRDRGETTHLRICAHAAELLIDEQAPYSHVVVDEAQDLHPAQWRVLRAAVSPGQDDLFVTGDPHQRIYDSRVSLGSLGISTAGRSSRLRVNYRSTEEILAWSARLLAPVTVDALDGEGTDSLAGYRSLLHGRSPQAQGYATRQEEIESLVDRIRALLAEGLAPREIGVCARFNLSLDAAEEKLKAAGIPVLRVKGQITQSTEGVRLATMHAMKGLEFRAVSVLSVDEGSVPFTRGITPREAEPVQHDADLLRERCLLFVACTRAREALSVTWSGTPSPFLPRPA
ncbi:UvrD/REP helicase N-terminal domain-containing protein [Streptomyces sp. DvalAA-14]|uniref:UvrD-helicase domain-containing protein n=1 Tax=unclassified Streptomyces TaxID=2593676 RepID=UPI00081B58AA|nr:MULTISPECIES: UvrD-helicase domain-containing protein [unclassified Streptomyces]MYS22506.1 UvrD-helicase domain-containing protein [Streptomyces sp. SID4948]SCE17377.1 UvrD/REP helicase N-terminal domain-containing protein [Streptomyces sp. DvalAA-14]